jgi:hypothetical protein
MRNSRNSIRIHCAVCNPPAIGSNFKLQTSNLPTYLPTYPPTDYSPGVYFGCAGTTVCPEYRTILRRFRTITAHRLSISSCRDRQQFIRHQSSVVKEERRASNNMDSGRSQRSRPELSSAFDCLPSNLFEDPLPLRGHGVQRHEKPKPYALSAPHYLACTYE